MAHFDANPPVGEVLSAVISNLLLPNPRPPLVLKPGNDALPLFFRVDAYPTVLVVNSAVVSFQYLGQHRHEVLTGPSPEGKRNG